MRKTRNIMNRVNAILLKITKKKFCWKNHALKGRNREPTDVAAGIPYQGTKGMISSTNSL